MALGCLVWLRCVAEFDLAQRAVSVAGDTRLRQQCLLAGLCDESGKVVRRRCEVQRRRLSFEVREDSLGVACITMHWPW